MENLAKRIDTEFLPFVIKPGRYLGNELGAINHPWDNRISIALAYPDLYDLGMSNLGLSILYHIINSRPNGRAERVFVPAEDAAKILREKQITLFSLESKTAIKNFDLLGFNSATELNYTNILDIIDLAEIPLLASERDDSDPLIVIGGGCAFNPEPLSDFADFFFLGDAEEAIVEMIDTLHNCREKSRAEKLSELSRIEGVYVPAYYQPQYSDTGKFSGLKKLYEPAPEKIKARSVGELKNSYYPERPVVPGIETVHDRLSVEIMRGCGHACRFCQATVIYKPARARRVEDIVSQAITSLEKSGYDEVTLLSLSSGDYKDIENLVRRLADRVRSKRITVSLPSLRITTLSLELAGLIMSNQKIGLTFAPEAGTERLRKVINKPLDEDTLVTVLGEAFKQGWQTIKLYFMIGLPTETEEDLIGIAELIRKLCRISDKYRGKRNFNITVSPFAPKSHTPWQWERQNSIEEIEQKRNFLKAQVRSRNVRLKFHNPRTTWLEGVLGRGDRRLGRVIYQAYKLGARMDGWSETFNFETWQRALEMEGIDPDKYLAERSTGNPLPWDHIEKGLSKESLLKDLAKSRGLFDTVTSLDQETGNTTEESKSKKKQEDKQISYGRAPKTVKTVSAIAVPNSRLRMKWGRSGLARFLSHLDNMRAIERALRRANLPIAFSQGYNPHPKFSFGPPLSLGFTSECEYLDVQLDSPVQEYMLERLAREFPPDFNLIGTRTVLGKASSLSSRLNLAEYTVELPLAIDEVSQEIDDILNSETFAFQRETKSGPIEVEARSAIINLACETLDNGNCRLRMQTGMADLGFVKPLELLQYGFGIVGEDLMKLTVHRKDLCRLENNIRIDAFEIL